MTPANLNNPFGESCCDGGGTSGRESAQSCGCDLGMCPPYYCERHAKDARIAELEAQIVRLGKALDNLDKAYNDLLNGQRGL